METTTNDQFREFTGIHEVNTNAQPALPFDGAEIEFHKKSGMMTLVPSAIALYLSKNQKDGEVIGGHKLRKELEKEPILNACVLDYLLANPDLIPKKWEKKLVFFWGTIFRDFNGALFVRGLIWFAGRWRSNYGWLDHGWRGGKPAAVSAI